MLLIALYFWLTLERAEVLKMLAGSFFPLAVLILAVLGSIVFGLATPTEAAAAGAFGGFVLTALYALARHPQARRIVPFWTPLLLIVLVVFGGRLAFDWRAPGWAVTAAWLSLAALAIAAYWQLSVRAAVNEAVYLTAKTSAMVCWLFVGSSIFSAAFALLGGQAGGMGARPRAHAAPVPGARPERDLPPRLAARVDRDPS